MALPLYLAQTGVEIRSGFPSPAFPAYMAVHFSPGGRGLSNFPESLPPGAMLILDDSTPMDGHDPEQILKELSALVERHQCESLLLDLQRPGYHELKELARELCRCLRCPVGVSEGYGGDLDCPLFLSPIPPDTPPAAHLAPWTGRELWLEAALEGIELTLTETGCTAVPLPDPPEDGRTDEGLRCHYTVSAPGIFRLWRTREDLDALLSDVGSLGVTRAIGLWQELER